MTEAYINRIATAVPPYNVHQAFLDFAGSLLQNDPQKLSIFYSSTGAYSFLANAVTLDDLIRCVEEMLNPSPAPAAKARVKTNR